MSDQDEISRLLAEAAAQTESPQERNAAQEARAEGNTSTEAKPSQVRKAPRRSDARNNDILGFAWFNSTLHAASFHRQKMTVSWSASTPVTTIEDFESVVDDAIALTGFGGTETFLLLENSIFMHQTDDIPVLKSKVQHNYLKNRIQRHEQEKGPVLWVVQPLVAQRQEQSILLHLLPRAFYDELNKVLLKRHLDLTRILPMIVPLQYELNRFPAAKNSAVILAAEVGTSTAVVGGRIGGPVLFSRTVLADINREPGRVGVEVNRSLLYAKQHFESAAASIWLMAENGASAVKELTAKCGGRKIVALPTTPVDWLQTAAKLSPKQPVNLLARYLKTKQRNRYIRGGILAAVWLGLALTVTNVLQVASDWNAEHEQLTNLRLRAPALRVERDRLDRRNRTIERDRVFIDRVDAEHLPPVPGKFLALVASLLPESARLLEFSVRWEPDSLSWSFQFSGLINTDDEIARTLIANLQDELNKSPLRVHFNENARVLIAAPITTIGVPEEQRFNLEGVLLEK